MQNPNASTACRVLADVRFTIAPQDNDICHVFGHLTAAHSDILLLFFLFLKGRSPSLL
jgi:hypothetical protein